MAELKKRPNPKHLSRRLKKNNGATDFLNHHVITDLLYMFSQSLVSSRRVWSMTYSRRYFGITSWTLLSSHSLRGRFPNFYVTGEISNKSPRKQEIFWFSLSKESLKHFHTPLRTLLELEWICGCPFHMLSLKVSLEVLAKSMIHGFCEIPGAISWAWLLSAPQSRVGLGRTLSPSRGLLRCRAVRNRRATLICSSWRPALNPTPTLSVHPRSGSHSGAAMGSICAGHRETLCHGAVAPTSHEWAAMHSPHGCLHCPCGNQPGRGTRTARPYPWQGRSSLQALGGICLIRVS